MATALDMLSVDRSRFVLDVVRALFTTGLAEGDMRQRDHLRNALLATPATPGESVPLPLDASIWRETLLQRPVPDNQIIGAILSDRRPRFSITGSPASTTRRSRGSGPSAIRCAICFGTPARLRFSDRACASRPAGLSCPAAPDAEPMWQAIVGADPAKPSAFVRRLFSDDSGVLAWFYDTMSQLDEPRLRFATSASLADTGPHRTRARAARRLRARRQRVAT